MKERIETNMAKVPDLKRITAEDFPKDDQELVKKLGFVINSFHEQTRDALNRNVNFENLAQEIKTLSFSTNETGQPLNPPSFKSTLNSRVQGILPIRTVITSSNTASAAENPIITWSQAINVITITNIGGLLPETGYELTILTM